MTIMLAFLTMFILCKLMKPAAIFHGLEHVNDFETISYSGHFVLQRQLFIAINIPCKFGEDIFINE